MHFHRIPSAGNRGIQHRIDEEGLSYRKVAQGLLSPGVLRGMDPGIIGNGLYATRKVLDGIPAHILLEIMGFAGKMRPEVQAAVKDILTVPAASYVITNKFLSIQGRGEGVANQVILSCSYWQSNGSVIGELRESVVLVNPFFHSVCDRNSLAALHRYLWNSCR